MYPPASGRLIAELTASAHHEGSNATAWPDLMVYRLSPSSRPAWDEAGGLALCTIARSDDVRHVVIGARGELDVHLTQAMGARPCVCMVLTVDPQLVRTTAATMGAIRRPTHERADAARTVPVIDDELTDTTWRLLRALTDTVDRRILAPLYLQELVFRTLRSASGPRLAHLAIQQMRVNPVAAALDYVNTHLAQPLSVDILAAQVSLSPSAFSRVFRQTTGRSPYQYVKEARLDRARILLAQGPFGVSDVARAVGYPSVSHFIKEFRSRYDTTPGDYLAA